MKFRIGYVSNSSTASYLVNRDLTEFGVTCMELTLEQKQLINGFANIGGDKIHIDVTKKIYLTQYVSGYDKEKLKAIEDSEHVLYTEGQLNGEPRFEEYYNEYSNFGWNSVYLLKEHDEAKQMTFNQFVKQFKDSDLPKDLIVKYTEDGIQLTYVK